jgi:hypothetical protein
VVGYVNLAAFVVVLLGMKGGWGSWLLVLAPPVVAVGGSALYYLAWAHLFPQIDKTEGRRYMRPYLLGLYLLIAAGALVFGLSQYVEHRGA